MPLVQLRPKGSTRFASIFHTPGERLTIEVDSQHSADEIIFVVAETAGGDPIFERMADTSGDKPTFNFSAELMEFFDEGAKYRWEIWSLEAGEYWRKAQGDLSIGWSILPAGFETPEFESTALPAVRGDGINRIVALSQAEYDALTPDAETLYVIQ